MGDWMARRLAARRRTEEVENHRKADRRLKATATSESADRSGGDESERSPQGRRGFLGGEWAVSREDGSSEYRNPVEGHDERSPFAPEELRSGGDSFSAEPDIFSIARFIFSSTAGAFWEVGGLRVRVGFDDDVRVHPPSAR